METEMIGASLSNGAIGLIGAGVACIAYGTNLVPVKRAEPGDGVFFLWILCSSAWIVGLVIHILRYCPVFYPLCMAGGFLWATGNLTVVPAMKTIGYGPAVLIWSSVSMVIGWATGYFGWFGLEKDQINRPTLNYIGFALAILRLFISVGVKQDPVSVRRIRRTRSQEGDLENMANDDRDELLAYVNEGPEERGAMTSSVPTSSPSSTDASWVDNLSLRQKRIVGCILAVLSGISSGINFVPCLWIQQNVTGASQNGLDYVFAYCCGMYAAGWAWFLIYAAYKQNRPQLPVGLVIPSMASGVILAFGKAGWFVANATISESVSFPIISTGPSIVASLWSVFFFREIRGARNYVLLITSLLVGAAGVTLSALSKV